MFTIENETLRFFIWFLLVTAATYLILLFLRPEFVRRKDAVGTPTEELSNAHVLILSIVIGIIFVLVLHYLKKRQEITLFY